MTTITTPIVIEGIAGWPGAPAVDMPASILGIKIPVKINAATPMMSQIQEKMSNNALAQRRAIIDPIPNHTKATAKTL
ncbi:MAG: hypothetical protein ACLQU4_21710 [Limisphaerales bacterium]